MERIALVKVDWLTAPDSGREDMAQPLRWVVRFPRPQRQELERLATQANFLGLACFNASMPGA
jgi:hypothetical protein